ncbi:DUF4230 domain-containing protein [Patescibacteria group bacterium]|nr:DUF4230 domain-containing protein [Patescibacteria group bacterium]MBU1721473.1 DUF4230 domain-containing protein [Patescibacteria group bacterium]MBU1900770.1 DUF4230 domain-containing protein [Patescibacteria group bacterium]
MKRIIVPILAALLFAAGLYGGYVLFSKDTVEETTVSRDVLLTALRDEGFLVSQVAMFDEKVTIEQSTGSAWKDFFWGQDIIARATLQVSSGVDLSTLTAEDVVMSDEAVEVLLPPVTIHAVELMGEVEVENNQGILKKLFDDNDGYNPALGQLQESARETAKKDQFRLIAEQSAIDTVERLLRFIEEDKVIDVKIK